MLVRLDLRARSFLADGLDAEPDFLFFLIHLDDLEFVLLSGFKGQGLAVGVDRLRVVAEAFDAFCDFYERTEAGHAQHLSVQHVADLVLAEEALPDIGLKLLNAQREAPLVWLD